MKPAADITRRRFVILGGATAASALCACAGADSGDRPAGTPAPGVYEVGHVSDFPPGTVSRIDDGPFFVIHDERGLYALTAICTHELCTVNVGQSELPCPCHGSIYDLQGNVIRGPAPQPLDPLELTVEADGTVRVDTGVAVARETRVST
jgi:Rieske Fe-S protein